MIKGGAPLSGEITAAGNKNAALPILAACLLTDEEVVLTNVPRIRDTETQVAVLEQLGVKADWTESNELRLQADAVTEHRARRGALGPDPRLVPARRARCWPASARRRCRRPAATSSAAGASTRTSTPSSDLGARVDGDRAIEITRPRGRAQAVRDLHGRALGDGHRERAAWPRR